MQVRVFPVTPARQRRNALTNEPRMSKVLVDKRVAAPLVTSYIAILANPWLPDESFTCSSYIHRKKKKRTTSRTTSYAFESCALPCSTSSLFTIVSFEDCNFSYEEVTLPIGICYRQIFPGFAILRNKGFLARIHRHVFTLRKTNIPCWNWTSERYPPRVRYLNNFRTWKGRNRLE